MDQYSGEALESRAEKAWQEKEPHRTEVREFYEFCMPHRERREQFTPGEKRTDKIFDSTGLVATKRFANRIVSGLFPPHREWARLEPGPQVPEEAKLEIAEALDLVTKKVFGVLHHQSNFQVAIGEWALDLATGTSAILVQRGGPELPVQFEPVPNLSFATEDGPDGSIVFVCRKPGYRNRELKVAWPDVSLTGELAAQVRDNPNERTEGIWEVTYLDQDKGTWHYCVLYQKEHLVKRVLKANPWVITRFYKGSRESFGRGPGLDALPDIKTLNKLVELVLKNAAIAVAGVYTVVDDGVVNPDNIRLAPGTFIPVARNNGHPAGASIAPLERAGDFDVSQLEQERLQMSIKKALLDDQLPPMEGPVRSATEIAERMQQLSQDVGAAFGRLIREAAVPLMQRSIDLLIESGDITELGPGVRIGGRGIAMRVVSPLAQSDNMRDVQAVAQTVEISAAIAGPEALKVAFKIEKLPEFVAQKMGFPASLIRNAEEQKAEQQKVAQAMAMAQQAMQQQGAPIERED